MNIKFFESIGKTVVLSEALAYNKVMFRIVDSEKKEEI